MRIPFAVCLLQYLQAERRNEDVGCKKETYKNRKRWKDIKKTTVTWITTKEPNYGKCIKVPVDVTPVTVRCKDCLTSLHNDILNLGVLFWGSRHHLMQKLYLFPVHSF